MSTKISARGSAGPLTGLEIVGLIQSGADKKATVNDILLLGGAPVGLTEILIDTANAGDTTYVVASGVLTVKIWKLYLIAGDDTTITFKDSTPLNLMGAIPLAQGGEIQFPKDTDPWMTCAAGKGFIINNLNAVQISGRAFITQA